MTEERERQLRNANDLTMRRLLGITNVVSETQFSNDESSMVSTETMLIEVSNEHPKKQLDGIVTVRNVILSMELP